MDLNLINKRQYIDWKVKTLIKGKYGFRITLIMFDGSTTVQQKVLQIKQEIMLLLS